MVVISHPTGNSCARAAVGAFSQRGLLERFFTTISWRSGGRRSQLIPAGLLKQLERRTFNEAPQHLIETRVRRELLRHVSERLNLLSLCVGEDALFSVDGVYRDFDRYVATQLKSFKHVNAVYAYEDGALATFEAAGLLGMRRVYDLPIGYWKASREFAEREAEESPDWASTLSALNDSQRKYERKDRELYLADKIVVASAFTKASLRLFPGFDESKVVVIPYGAPVPTTRPRRLSDKTKPLRVLYVGSLSQRKGLSYMVEAMKLLGGKAELTLIGRPTLPIPKRVEEMCMTYRWIPTLPHGELLDEMSRQDVLLFPSLFEGFGLVITEAISQGLPVITTTHTGGPEVLREGVDGFIVPVRSAEAIAARLQQLADDRELLDQMSRSALERAGEMGWQNYQDRLVHAVLDTEVHLTS